MKKVFIGVLAALMLFAFVACDNSGANAGAEYIAYVEATQNSGVVYVEGEKVDPADFTFKGYDVIGNEVATIPSSMFEVPATVLAAKEDNAITFTSSVSSMYGALTAEVEVAAEEVTGIKVDATNAEKTYYTVIADYAYEDEDARKEISKNGIVVTAIYEGGEKIIDNELVSFDESKMGDWDEAVDVCTITVKFAEETATFDVTLAENLVKSVELLATKDYKLFTDVTGKDVLKYATSGKDDTNGGIYMNKIMQGGETVLIKSETGNIKYYSGDAGDYTFTSCDSVVIPENGGTITVRAKYVGTDCAVGATRTDDIAVTAEKDSVAKVEVTAVPSSLQNINYNEEESLPGVTVKVTMASGDTPATTVALKNAESEAKDNYFVLSQMDLTKATVGDRISITFSGVAKGQPFSKTTAVLIVADSSTESPEVGGSNI